MSYEIPGAGPGTYRVETHVDRIPPTAREFLIRVGVSLGAIVVAIPIVATIARRRAQVASDAHANPIRISWPGFPRRTVTGTANGARSGQRPDYAQITLTISMPLRG